MRVPLVLVTKKWVCRRALRLVDTNTTNPSQPLALASHQSHRPLGVPITRSSACVCGVPCWQIEVLPPDVARLTRLQALDLRGNRLTTLPLSLSAATSLRLLDVTDNALVLPLRRACAARVGQHHERGLHPLPVLALLAAGETAATTAAVCHRPRVCCSGLPGGVV